jgi:hypothetical protein
MPQPKDKTKVKEWKSKISNSLKGRRCCMRTEFAKGHIPFNKGTIGLTKRNKTSFKKGNIPANYMGSMKICEDGIYVIDRTKSYSYIRNGKKIFAYHYEQLARKKYREHFGDFPKEMIIFHKDKDVFNNEIDNLELITRAELLKRNQYKNKNKCFICGKEFLARRKSDKTCSKKCYKENCKILAKEYHKNNREKFREYQRRYKEKLKGKI